MRVVLVHDIHCEREPMVRALREAPCQVEGVGSVKEALAAIAQEPPDVIVALIWPYGGADVVMQLRSADGAGGAHILVVIKGDPKHLDISTYLAAGANGVVRAPIADSELVARVKHAGGALAARLQREVAPVVERSNVAIVSRLQAWQNIGSLALDDLVGVIQHPLRVCDRPPSDFASGLRGATIPMSLASANICIDVSVVTDSSGRQWLSNRLLGDPSAIDASFDDVLRELANVSGGAFKRAARSESVTLTTGLPVSNFGVAWFGSGIRCWTAMLEDGTERIAIVGRIHSVETRRVSASGLLEGMVLTSDLRSETGQLLATAGSRLTQTTATRLAKLLGSRVVVEVARAA